MATQLLLAAANVPSKICGVALLEQSQQEFCAALKAARERRGLKLTDIAEVTKVCPSYFSALERNDLRVWPKGLFRRSFFRGYVGTIGLPVEPLLEEFMRLFPEDQRTAVAPGAEESDFRLTLDDSWTGARPPVMARLCAAALDALAIAAITAGVSWSVSLPADLAFAIVAMTYFLLATVLIAETPARYCLRRGARLAGAVRSIFAPAPAAQPADVAPVEDRSWFSDAHRVSSREQAPSLRVRFKVSS